jgi:predicted GIY-YIG superfamily endonuclease
MPASQQLFFSDPKPLVDRLGREFFLTLPETPGVYLMRDAADTVLYVGKAKNLRQRLASYRVANPERLKRRHLRLLHQVRRIEIQDCRDEAAALAREAEFLLALKPKFNRAGTWPAKPRFLAWRCARQSIELCVFSAGENEARTSRATRSSIELQDLAQKTISLSDGWQTLGPLGTSALFFRAALARLLRVALSADHGFTAIPAGWASGFFSEPTVICCPDTTSQLQGLLNSLFAGQPEPFSQWLHAQIPPNTSPFDLAILAADLETVTTFASEKSLGL